MNLNPDDPRLTAYALGELDEAESAEIEAALRNSPEAQAEVEAIRATASLLQGEFAGEDALALTPAQRQRLEAAAEESDVQPAFVPRPRPEERRGAFDWIRLLVWSSVGVAAVALAVSVVPLTQSLHRAHAKPTVVTSVTDAEARQAGAEALLAAKPGSTPALAANGPFAESGRKRTGNYFDGAKADGDKLTDGSGVTTLAVVPPVDSAALSAPASAPTDSFGRAVEQEVKRNATLDAGLRAAESPDRNAPAPAPAPTSATAATDSLALGVPVTTTRERLVAEPGREAQQVTAGGAVAASPVTTGKPAQLDPILARRYGLPVDGSSSPAAAPPKLAGMDPILAKRYGLAPQQPSASAQPTSPSAVAPQPTPTPMPATALSTLRGAATGSGVVAPGSESNRGQAGRADHFSGLGRSGSQESKQLSLAYQQGSLAKGEAEVRLKSVADESRRTTDSYPLAESQPRYRYFKAPPAPGTESYAAVADNPFREVTASPLSTFSIDVDTASYANVRRFLREGQRPPPDAVRLEELVNYFTYDYPQPRGEHPFSATVDVASCPWTPDHKLVRVGIKAKNVERRERPHANLIFLIDVSGSMEPENKLPLVKRGFRLLVDRLGAADYVGIVTYAGRAEIALEPTSCDDKATILAAIDRLVAGSGTNGGEGIQRAYELARRRFEKSAINRIILCTDGDFNVGITSRDDLKALIENEAKSGVFLSVLGFGMGNTKDDTMEMLADKGNGHYAYVDSFTEARKVFSEQLEGTLITVAKDVKIQVEFNPAKVATWRLLGYENRVMADRDFNDDRKDAGEVGAGHTVTALYEVVPVSMVAGDRPEIDGLRYRETPAELESRERQRVRPAAKHTDELLFLKVRYKKPDGDQSILMEQAVKDGAVQWKQAPADFKFAAAVAGFGMILRDSPHRGDTSFESVLRLAEEGLGRDENGHRAEFIDLVRRAQSLK